VILASISLTTIFSLNRELFFTHAINFFLAGVVFLVFSQVDYRLFQPLAKPIYFVSLILLAIVFVLGIENRGAIRWIYIFGVSIQFSELLKPFLTLSLAGYLASGRPNSPRGFLSVFLLLAPIVMLINLQPDLGNGLVYLGATVFTLLVYGYPLLWFVLLFLPLLLASPLLWNLMHDYQRQRLLTFLHPGSDPLGTSYNVVQALIAVGAGKMLGRGIGEGTQSGLRFLPERHTDFIFASISEGFGLVGAGIVIICFIYLLFRIYRVHLRSDDSFARVFCAGAFFFILIQFFVNIGMNLGILPVVGITLPFVSYGGSSLVSCAIFLGIISAIGRESLREKVLEIK
jgi:rod shape determining protein RodA